MNLDVYFRSVVEQDNAPIVICDLNHIIIYMNKVAIERFAKRGGKELIGKSLLLCHNSQSCQMIEKIVSWFKENDAHNIIYESYNEKENKDVYIVALRDENAKLIGYYEKHEYRNNEIAKPYSFN